jgi:hypothetical protein
MPTSATENGGHNPPYEHDPADLVEQADLHALLRTLIDDLPLNQREALDLWADGFNYLQIASITKHSEGHIRVLVHRGLKALREHPRVRGLVEDDSPAANPSTVNMAPNNNTPAAQRRNHVAVGVSPRKTELQKNENR